MREHYGTEPPNNESGWTYQGDMRWTKEEDGPKIAVVGGGPGGLFTAYILNQRFPSAQVCVFEACEGCGGKIRTGHFEDGTPFEVGVAELYEYKGSDGADPLRTLIEKDLGLETIDIAGGGVIIGNDIMRDIDEVEEVYGAETRKRIEDFHKRMVELMPLEKYAQRWQPDNSHPWADKTFRDAIEEELKALEGVDENARRYIEIMVHSDLATESHTCNGLNGIKNVLMDNEDYMQLYHVVGGIEHIVDMLLDRINADFYTSTRITGITKVDDGYEVHCLKIGERTLSDSSEVFDAVVVALPNHWLRIIDWGAGSSLAKAIHATVSHYDLPAHYLRVSILFSEKWWAHLDMPGEYWMMDICNGCCVYDESTRWGRNEGDEEELEQGHVLSFLIAGGDALLMCSSNQDDDCIVDYILHSLPPIMREDAETYYLDAQVDRYVGSINAQPGGWPAEELRGEHQPDPNGNPGVFLVGDYLFDSTLNAALMSANIAVELLLEYFGATSAEVTEAIELLEAKDTGV